MLLCVRFEPFRQRTSNQFVDVAALSTYCKSHWTMMVLMVAATQVGVSRFQTMLIAALLLFGIGVVIGLVAEDRLLWALDSVPRAATHLFMTGPISYLAAGAALAVSQK